MKLPKVITKIIFEYAQLKCYYTFQYDLEYIATANEDSKRKVKYLGIEEIIGRKLFKVDNKHYCAKCFRRNFDKVDKNKCYYSWNRLRFSRKRHISYDYFEIKVCSFKQLQKIFKKI